MSTSIPACRSTSASPPSSSRKAAKSSATASAPSSRPSSRVSADPFYGHEETATLCARFITSLFQCPNIPTATAPGAPTPALAHFVAYALHRTRLPSIVTFAALLLLQRLKVRFPAARGSSGHRLFISAFMIASKVICDDTYSNQSWGIVAQKLFALKEINQMEREMCSYLEWNLNLVGDEVVEFEARVKAECGSQATPGAYPIDGSKEHYPTPDPTPDPPMVSRPIRPVPYKNRPSYQAIKPVPLPSPPSSPGNYRTSTHSPQPPYLASSSSSLASSPASDDCKTPSPVAPTLSGSAASSHKHSSKALNLSRTYEGQQLHRISNIACSGYPINVGGPVNVGVW